MHWLGRPEKRELAHQCKLFSQMYLFLSQERLAHKEKGSSTQEINKEG
jgi:hypothetical protein